MLSSHGPWAFWPQDSVRSQCGNGTVSGELSLPANVCTDQLSTSRDQGWCSLLRAILHRLPHCNNWTHWDLGLMWGRTPMFSTCSASFLRTYSCHHLYRPWVKALWQPHKMCCNFPGAVLHRSHFSSMPYHLDRLVGVGRVSYMALTRKLSLAWGILQRSLHPIDLGRIPSHFVHFPCWHWLTDLTRSLSFFILFTPVTTITFFSLTDDLDQSFCGFPQARPHLACLVVPTSSWCFRLEIALSTHSSAFHALPVQIFTPSWTFLNFLESICCHAFSVNQSYGS